MSWFAPLGVRLPQVGNHCSRERCIDWTATLKFLFKRKELITWFSWHLSQLYIKLIPTSQRVECITITKTNILCGSKRSTLMLQQVVHTVHSVHRVTRWVRHSLPQVTNIQSCDNIKLPTLLDCLELYILKHPIVPIWNHTVIWKLTLRTQTKSSTLCAWEQRDGWVFRSPHGETPTILPK